MKYDCMKPEWADKEPCPVSYTHLDVYKRQGVDRFQHNFYSLSKVLPLPVVVNR